MKRTFNINGVQCRAILKAHAVDIEIALPQLPITSHLNFKPLTPRGIMQRQFRSDYPEQVAEQIIKQCQCVVELSGGRA